jgi:uncharacterized protein DUF4252
MKTLLVATVMAALACELASAQKLNLDLSALAAKAASKNEVTLEGPALQMFQQAAASKGDKAAADNIGKMFSGIEGVVVRNYKFAMAGEYSDRDLEPLRQQTGSGSGWSRIINVKEKDGNTEIYVYNQGGGPMGMLVIAAKAKELTVVQISGSVQLAQLKELVNSTIHFDPPNVDAAGAKQ